MDSQRYKTIIPISVSPTVEELSAAKILAKFFHANVEFVPRAAGRTPDFMINGQMWELKSLRTVGKYTIQHRMSSAKAQAQNIVIDLRLITKKYEKDRALRDINKQSLLIRELKKVIVIISKDKIIEVK